MGNGEGFTKWNFVMVINSRLLRRVGHEAKMQEGRSAFKILTGTPTGKCPLGRPRHRWEDTIRMDLKEIGISTRNSVGLTQDRDYGIISVICNTL